jgi:hypothetical protein
MASGGADSTILAYIMATVATHRSPRLFMLRSDNIALPRMESIIALIEQKTGYRYPLTVFKEKTFIRPSVEKILGVYDGVVYTGCNRVVEGMFYPTIHIKGDTPPIRGPAFDHRHLRPFIDMDKIDVIMLYKQYKVLDLLALTRSCGLDEGRCEGCYFCLERKWACEYLGITDK